MKTPFENKSLPSTEFRHLPQVTSLLRSSRMRRYPILGVNPHNAMSLSSSFRKAWMSVVPFLFFGRTK